MKKLLCLRVLLAIVLLVSMVSLSALLLPENPATAAQKQSHKPEKLRIDGISWDQTSQQFIIDISCHWGIAQPGDKAFLVSTVLGIDRDIPNNETIFVSQETPVIKREGASRDSEHMIQLAPQEIGWDRVNHTYEGTVFLTINVVLKNPSGNTLGSQVTKNFTLSVN